MSRDYRPGARQRARACAAAGAVHRRRRILRTAQPASRLHRPVRRDRPAGRSLGMHLLLASQRLDEGRLRGLESHLSYRVCLKTFSASESRSVLGVPDAYHLPSAPGAAYLKTGSGDPLRFQTAFVSGPYEVRRSFRASRLQRRRRGCSPRRRWAAPRSTTEQGTDRTPASSPDRARHGPRSTRGSRIARTPSVVAAADRVAHARSLCCSGPATHDSAAPCRSAWWTAPSSSVGTCWSLNWPARQAMSPSWAARGRASRPRCRR